MDPLWEIDPTADRSSTEQRLAPALQMTRVQEEDEEKKDIKLLSNEKRLIW